MPHRTLYIAAYDVSDNARLRDALKVLKGYASGRQKSVFECFLTDAER
ncbi:MAG: CRISPR-associated endonuclease Cas2, partial [Lamprobacter sp.]